VSRTTLDLPQPGGPQIYTGRFAGSNATSDFDNSDGRIRTSKNKETSATSEDEAEAEIDDSQEVILGFKYCDAIPGDF